jgi:integrase
VLQVLKPIWTTRPETASRLRGRIERVLDAAKALGHRSGENPALWRGHLANLLPKRQKLTRGHHAALPFSELPAFMVKLRERDAFAARALEFTILTAARSGEVYGARWSEIDWDAKVWTVPANRMKAGRAHRVPLTPAVMRILEVAAKLRTDDGLDVLVFPSRKAGQPMSGMAMKMLLRRMGYDAITVHGFRSSFRDWAGERTHFPWEVAEAALAHVIGDETERAYRRGDALEKRRELMEAWAAFCESQPDNNVVSLIRRA